MIKTLLIATLLFSGSSQFVSKRMLLIYADKETDHKLIEQKKLLASDPSGLHERDIEVKVYLQAEHKEAFAKMHLKKPFTVILLGKDGGEKLRMHDVLSLQKLYGTIDAMPMRKQEMKKQ